MYRVGELFGDEHICVIPCSLADAQCLVSDLHRNCGKVVGHKFSLKALIVYQMRVFEVGAAILGHPDVRLLDDGGFELLKQ